MTIKDNKFLFLFLFFWLSQHSYAADDTEIELEFIGDDFSSKRDDIKAENASQLTDIMWNPGDFQITWPVGDQIPLAYLLGHDVFCEVWFFVVYRSRSNEGNLRAFTGSLLRARADTVLDAAMLSLESGYKIAKSLFNIVSQKSSAPHYISLRYGLTRCYLEQDERPNLISRQSANLLQSKFYFSARETPHPPELIDDSILTILKYAEQL